MAEAEAPAGKSTTREDIPAIEFKLVEFIEEVDTLIWERSQTAEKKKMSVEFENLFQLRMHRLRKLGEYLRKIDAFQRGKPAIDIDRLERDIKADAVDEKPAPPAETLPPKPQPVEEVDDFGD